MPSNDPEKSGSSRQEEKSKATPNASSGLSGKTDLPQDEGKK